MNAFQSQPEDANFWTSKWPNLLLRQDGHLVGDPDWPGEYLLDTSTAAKRTQIAVIIDGWIDDCAGQGFQAVEPDNLDSWIRSKGLLTEADNLAQAKLFALDAHRRGLAIGQKNAGELGSAGKATVGFDFAIAEECQLYHECARYTGPYGRHVIEIEYTDNPRSAYTQACADRGEQIAVILRDRNVVARGQAGYHYSFC